MPHPPVTRAFLDACRWHLAVTNNKGTILHDLTLVALWIAFGISRPITMLLGLKSTWSLLW